MSRTSVALALAGLAWIACAVNVSSNDVLLEAVFTYQAKKTAEYLPGRPFVLCVGVTVPDSSATGTPRGRVTDPPEAVLRHLSLAAGTRVEAASRCQALGLSQRSDPPAYSAHVSEVMTLGATRAEIRGWAEVPGDDAIYLADRVSGQWIVGGYRSAAIR